MQVDEGLARRAVAIPVDARPAGPIFLPKKVQELRFGGFQVTGIRRDGEARRSTAPFVKEGKRDEALAFELVDGDARIEVACTTTADEKRIEAFETTCYT